MENVILELLASGGTHGLLIVAVIVLWRENRRLMDKLESIRQVAASTHAMTLDQNRVLEKIESQTCPD